MHICIYEYISALGWHVSALDSIKYANVAATKGAFIVVAIESARHTVVATSARFVILVKWQVVFYYMQQTYDNNVWWQ